MSKRKVVLLTTPILIFIGTMILANIASRMQGPFLPLYLQSLGADIGQVGLFFTLSSIAPLAFQILGGWISDSIGRLRAIAIGSIGGVFSYIVFLLAPSWEWLILAIAGTAMASAFVAPSFQAFIAEQSAPEDRGKFYGMTEGIFTVVGIIGPTLGGLISDNFSFKRMFLVAGVMYTLAAVIRIWMAKHYRSSDGQKHTPISFKNFRMSMGSMIALILAGGLITWIMITDGVRDIAWSLSGQLFPIYLEDLKGLTVTQIGVLSSIGSIFTMALMIAGGWLSDKKGERIGIILGWIILISGMCVFLTASSFAMFIVAYSLFGIGEALMAPAYNSLISKAVPEKLRGTAFGLFSTSLGVISLPAPLLGAMMWKKFGPIVPLVIPVIISTLLLPIIWFKFKVPKETQEAAAEEIVAESGSPA